MGRVSKFNQSISWHHHMKYHVESCHLIKFVAFRVNRDQIMDLEKLKKLKTNQFLSNGRVVKISRQSAHFIGYSKKCVCCPKCLQLYFHENKNDRGYSKSFWQPCIATKLGTQWYRCQEIQILSLVFFSQSSYLLRLWNVKFS